MNEAIQKLIDAVQKASPVVWQAAYRQVWIDAVEAIITIIILLYAARWMYQRREELIERDKDGYRKVDTDDPGPVLLGIGVVVCLLLSVPCLWFAMDSLLNPTFAAIKELKGLL